ncbi:DMT family transporter [Ruminococcus sp. CLA-AA-H200]|uniref:DMT family transporter n=1 Tax=Ruminococcus turbiniformis TaxID=2881258 RepID=A0ABS8FWQ0_9FIRM|nr:DMT family transporter [Ruminococcus turbiniformis]MCC2254478.1 DMT family transporter [Ruminococcus turbiniformis]
MNVLEKKEQAKKLYEDRKVKLAVLGLVLAWISALSLVIFQNFNVRVTEMIGGHFAETLLFTYILSLVVLGICELFGGILMIIFNTVRGIPLAEYPRIWRVKASRVVLASAFLGGPVATACSIVGISFCGSTYGNCIIGLTPVVTAILGTIFLKEKTGVRVFVGIFITVVGVVIASIAPPEGVSNFYLGLLITAAAPIGYAIEAVLSTKAIDISDPLIVCPLYRMIGGGCMELCCALIICTVTGHAGWIGEIFTLIFSDKVILLFLLLAMVFLTIQYNEIYVAYSYCGATRGSAILFSSPIWSIPIGLVMDRMGILSFSVTLMGIIGAAVLVVGIFVVLAKPSELFNLRDVS